jgi:hypothetical protein
MDWWCDLLPLHLCVKFSVLVYIITLVCLCGRNDRYLQTIETHAMAQWRILEAKEDDSQFSLGNFLVPYRVCGNILKERSLNGSVYNAITNRDKTVSRSTWANCISHEHLESSYSFLSEVHFRKNCRDSSVRIAIRYRMDGPRIESRCWTILPQTISESEGPQTKDLDRAATVTGKDWRYQTILFPV